jgi:acetyltransferase-like isoleucine patch superfamily enzyme
VDVGVRVADGVRRVGRVVANEFGIGWVPWRVVRVGVVAKLLPEDAGGRIRSVLYRWAGIRIGERTAVRGPLPLRGGAAAAGRLRIGTDCVIYSPLSIDCAADVTIGDGVTLGPHVCIVTANHETDDPTRRAGALRPAAVEIGDGAWVGAGAWILPGVRIGAGAVVGAAAVVTRDVPAHTVVAGTPARPLRVLDAADLS